MNFLLIHFGLLKWNFNLFIFLIVNRQVFLIHKTLLSLKVFLAAYKFDIFWDEWTSIHGWEWSRLGPASQKH